MSFLMITQNTKNDFNKLINFGKKKNYNIYNYKNEQINWKKLRITPKTLIYYSILKCFLNQ